MSWERPVVFSRMSSRSGCDLADRDREEAAGLRIVQHVDRMLPMAVALSLLLDGLGAGR